MWQTIPISMRPLDALTPCLGVMCELHGSCARYAAINGAHAPSSTFLGLCTDGLGGRPLYVKIALRLEPETVNCA